MTVPLSEARSTGATIGSCISPDVRAAAGGVRPVGAESSDPSGSEISLGGRTMYCRGIVTL